MPYNLNHYNGNPLTTINDGLIDSVSTPIKLPGPDSSGYGPILNENLIYMLENFAGNGAPSGNNLIGQLWFNTNNQTLNVFTNQGYLPVNGLILDSSQPLNAVNGNFWFNTTTNQLFLYSNGVFDLVGPLYTKSQGISGAIPLTVNDANTSGVTRNIITLQFGSLVIATISSEIEFVPSPAIPGFPIIYSGITLNNQITNTAFNSSVIGNLTGNVTGSLTGTSVSASFLTGNLTGNVVGSSVTATNLIGNLQGNTVSQSGVANNFSSSNVLISGGSITGLTGLGAGAITGTTASFSGSITAVNPSFTGVPTVPTAPNGTANTQIASTAFVQSSISFATASLGSMSTQNSGNISVTGGNVSGLSTLTAGQATLTSVTSTNASATTLVSTNFSSGNAQINGGNANNLTNLTVTTAQATNFSSANTQITSGNILGLTNLSTTNLSAGPITASSASFTGTVSAGTISLTGNISASSAVLSGTLSASSPSFTGTPTAPTAPTGTNNTQIATTAFVNSAIASAGITGQITMWPVSNPPTGWLICNGQAVSRSAYSALYSIIGTTFGSGDGSSTFNLPNYNDRMPIGVGSTAGSAGSTGGSKTSTITQDNLPNVNFTTTVSDPGHKHTITLPFGVTDNSYSGGGQGQFGGGSWTVPSGDIGSSTTGISVSVNSGGSGSAFNTISPYLGIYFIIKT